MLPAWFPQEEIFLCDSATVLSQINSLDTKVPSDYPVYGKVESMREYQDRVIRYIGCRKDTMGTGETLAYLKVALMHERQSIMTRSREREENSTLLSIIQGRLLQLQAEQKK